MEKFRHRTPGLLGATCAYAVLVPLVLCDGVPQLLFEVRAQTLSRQPGEVCFPGGKMEPGERPIDCALRETWEELGIPPSAVQHCTPLDFICHQSGFLLHPILAEVDAAAVAAIRPEPAEVSAHFLVPLAHFRAHPPVVATYRLTPEVPPDFPYAAINAPAGYAWRGGTVEVPIYRWQDKAIWGMTGRIVREVARL